MPELSPPLRWTLLVMGALGLLTAFAMVVSDFGQPFEEGHTFDDAYMFQRYARHILDGYGSAWNPGGPPTYGCTSVTHLLWVTALMAVLPALHPQDLALLSSAIPYALLVVAGVGVCLRRYARDPVLGAAAFAVWGFVVALGFLVHGRSGMDTSLAVLVGLVTASATALWERRPNPLGAVGLALLGLVVWNTRPDLALVAFGVPGLIAVLGGHWSSLGALVGTAAVGLAIDLAVKVQLLGSALPLPLAAKQHGAYQVYLGLGRWNPGDALVVALSLGVPFLVWSMLTQPVRRLAAWLLPVVAVWMYLCTVVQIMGYFGRFDVPALAWVFVLAASSEGPLRRERAVPIGATLGGAYLAILALRVGYAASVPEPRLLPAVDLANINGYTAMASVGRIAARIPGSTIAASEHGIVGALAPETSIIDLVGLHDPAFASGETGVSRVFDAKPALIWMPPADYPVLRQALFDHPGFDDYAFVDGAFHLGMGVRRDDPEARRAFVEVFEEVYGEPPTFLDTPPGGG